MLLRYYFSNAANAVSVKHRPTAEWRSYVLPKLHCLSRLADSGDKSSAHFDPRSAALPSCEHNGTGREKGLLLRRGISLQYAGRGGGNIKEKQDICPRILQRGRAPMTYLDNAATSYPKPPQVLREVQKCLSSYCGNPGRGSHALSNAAGEKIYEVRELTAELFGCGNPENVIFTMNDTYALNMAIKGALRPGDHVLISNFEHNSVYRPVRLLADCGLIEYSVFDALSPNVTEQIAALVRPNTRAVIANHTSNICSLTLPMAKIGALCRKRGLLLIADAAQSAGHGEIQMEKMNIDILCAPAHKGLMGIQGCGLLAFRDGVPLTETLIEGGSGVNSLEAQMPEEAPERFEAGTLPTPAIAALGEGIKFVRSVGVSEIKCHVSRLFDLALDRLSSLPETVFYSPEHRGATLLFGINGKTSDQVSALLNDRGICTRSGFHCCPLGHAALGTPKDGAVRISFGYFNRESDVDKLYKAIKSIVD